MYWSRQVKKPTELLIVSAELDIPFCVSQNRLGDSFLVIQVHKFYEKTYISNVSVFVSSIS